MAQFYSTSHKSSTDLFLKLFLYILGEMFNGLFDDIGFHRIPSNKQTQDVNDSALNVELCGSDHIDLTWKKLVLNVPVLVTEIKEGLQHHL